MYTIKTNEVDIFFYSSNTKYSFLSNFYPASIFVSGVLWPTAEHYYQALKTLNPEEREAVRNCLTPKAAKAKGYHLTLRAQWDESQKEIAMREVIYHKFTQHLELKNKLIATGNVGLHENSPTDTYWGYARGKGRDRLGKLLMELRNVLRR